MPAAAARSASSGASRAAAAPARRVAPRRAQPVRTRPKPVPGPVGRTAGAVGNVADWGLVYRLTRGRLWIGVLAALLVGIVALNVMALSFSAASSKTASNADELKRVNSSLRAQIAAGLSNDRVQRKAEASGLHTPPAGSIRYLRGNDQDAAIAAKRLDDGSLTVGSSVTTVTPPADTSTLTPTDPTTTPVDPAVTTDPTIATTTP